MRYSRQRPLIVAATLAILLCACGESSPARPTPPPPTSAEPSPPEPTAPPQPTVPPPQDEPAADGTCTRTHGENRSTFVYASGLMQRSESTFGRSVTTYTYEDGRLSRVERRASDRLTFVSQISYDDRGRVAEVVRSEPSPSSSTELVELDRRTFAYDSAGRLERVTIGPGEATGFIYDPQGRLFQQISTYPGDEPPLRMRYGRDSAGRLVSIDAGNVRWAYHYDASGHRDRATRTDAEGNVIGVEELAHDDAGRLVDVRVAEGMGEAEHAEYDGTFGSGARCGELMRTPPGIPSDFDWLGMSP